MHTSNPGALMQTLSACICKNDCDMLKQNVCRVVIAIVVVPSHHCLHSTCFCDRLHPRMMLKLLRRIDKINGIEKFNYWSTYVITYVQLIQKSSTRNHDSTDLAHPVLPQHCDLDEHVAERLKMNHVSHTRNGKKERKKLNRKVTMWGIRNEDKTGWRKGTIAFKWIEIRSGSSGWRCCWKGLQLWFGTHVESDARDWTSTLRQVQLGCCDRSSSLGDGQCGGAWHQWCQNFPHEHPERACHWDHLAGTEVSGDQHAWLGHLDVNASQGGGEDAPHEVMPSWRIGKECGDCMGKLPWSRCFLTRL